MKKMSIKPIYRVPLIYFLFSVLWILFSDKIAFAASPDLSRFALFSTIKGLLFVFLSTLLIYLLLRNYESSKERLLREMVGVQRSFNLLFEDNPQPMWIYDNQSLEIMAVNPSACRTYGYTDIEFRKLKITELHKPDEVPELLMYLTEHKDDLRQSGPVYHLKKGGETILVKVISHPLRSAGMDTTLVSVVDLTEQEKMLNDLDTAMQERDDYESFGYTASHDLKAPLRAIIGYSDLLKKEYKNRLDVEGNEFVNQIHKAGINMNEMLDEMLILTGIIRKPLSYDYLNMTELYEDIFKTLQLHEPKRKVKVTIQPKMEIIADIGVVKLITLNLVQNAWKYTNKTPRARIQAGSHVNKNGETVFFVKDNGLGFDQSLADEIFEPFKRGHVNSKFEGMGIGLSIVRRAVERHGGRVWVESEPGKGACFSFTLQQKESTDGALVK